LSREFLKAYNMWAKVEQRRNAGDYSDDIDQIFPVPEKKKGLLMSEVIEFYAKEKERAWTDKSRDEILANIELFKEFVGDVPITDINRARVSDFRRVLMELPSNMRKKKKYCDKTLKELIEMEIPEEDRLANRTINKIVGRVGTFFEYAIDNEFYKDSNPAKNMKLTLSDAEDESKAPYGIGDLEK